MTIELTAEELRDIYIALEVRADRISIKERAEKLYTLAGRLRSAYVKEAKK